MVSRDAVLERLGLKKKSSYLDWLIPTLLGFGGGVILGVSMGLLLAPEGDKILLGATRTSGPTQPLDAANTFAPQAST